MQQLKSGGGGKNGRRGNPHMADLRMALAALTGEDQGNDESAWIHWWAEHDERYELPKSVVLPRQLERLWNSVWGEAPKGGKRKKGGT